MLSNFCLLDGSGSVAILKLAMDDYEDILKNFWDFDSSSSFNKIDSATNVILLVTGDVLPFSSNKSEDVRHLSDILTCKVLFLDDDTHNVILDNPARLFEETLIKLLLSE